MDASHFVVGGLTIITAALLVWIELRSRRNVTRQESKSAPAGSAGEEPRGSD